MHFQKHSEKTKEILRQKEKSLWQNLEYRQYMKIIHKGQHSSPETEFKKGNHYSPETEFKKGQKIRLGIKHLEKAKEKMSQMKKGKFSKLRGKNSHFWKGGISPKNHIIRQSMEFRLWRESVFARDNWTCQKCKIKGGKLHPHHIKSFAEYPELRFVIDNGITLCENCHYKFHKSSTTYPLDIFRIIR